MSRSRRKNSNLLSLNCHFIPQDCFFEEDIKIGFLLLFILAIKTCNICSGYEFLEGVILIIKTSSLGGKNAEYLLVYT